MSISNKRPAIVSWIRTVTGYDATHVIWKNQNFGRPSKPYIDLLIMNSQAIGQDFKFQPDTPLAGTVVGNRELTLSISAYSLTPGTVGYVDPLDVLERIRQSLDVEDIYDVLILNDIAFVDTLLSPADTTTLLDNQYEPRASMDLLIRIPYSSVDATLTYIERIALEKTFKDVDQSTILVENIEIPAP